MTQPVESVHLPDYTAARRYLEQYVPGPDQFTPPDTALARTVALLGALDNPQEACPVIHLAGTSGKGSTATILDALLRAHGLYTGLGLSPHVRSLAERIQLDGTPIDPARFTAAVNALLPAIDHVSAGAFGPPSFFEISIALSYMVFAGRISGSIPADAVIMETGLGGRTDATNVVRRRDKLALFTPIDLDHTELLGDSVTQIAREKAGIIQPGNMVISIHQDAAAQAVLEEACHRQAASLRWFDPAIQLRHVRPDVAQVSFDMHWPDPTGNEQVTWCDLTLSLGGAHQAANAGLALVAARHFLTARGMSLDEANVRAALSKVTMPGRMDLAQVAGRPILLDGAHNPQKMQALVAALTAAYPDERFCFIIALKHGKDLDAVLRQLLPHAAYIVVTQFDNRDQGMLVQAAAPKTIAEHLTSLGYADFEVADDMDAALARALRWTTDHAATTPIVITGSLYLLAEAYTSVAAAQSVA